LGVPQCTWLKWFAAAGLMQKMMHQLKRFMDLCYQWRWRFFVEGNIVTIGIGIIRWNRSIGYCGNIELMDGDGVNTNYKHDRL
jgi:hypothetical protein